MPKHLYSTLSQAVEALRRLGFAAHFTYDEKTRTIAAEGRSYKGEDLRIVDQNRSLQRSFKGDSGSELEICIEQKHYFVDQK